VLVTASGTDAGKTWVAAEIITLLTRAGHRVSARKPVQSYEPGTGPTDAEVLASASGETPNAVCSPRHWYPVPMAPPMAAAALGRRPFVLADLLAGMRVPGTGRWIVEGVGGVRSPLAEDADTVRLAEALAPRRIVFVVASGLGAVNAVLLARDALRRWPFTVFLNRFQPELDVHTRTAAWLAGRERISVATTIDALAASCWPEAWPPHSARS